MTLRHPSNISAVVITCALAAAVVMLVGGCATKPPTDATAAAIADTQAATERASAHLDRSIELNLQIQRDLNTLRHTRPAGAK